MKTQIPLTRDLVLIGGGHTHALVLRKWGMNPLPGARLTVINPGPTAPYSGMLPGFVAGHYDRDELDIDLVRLARFAGARVIIGSATGLDPVAKTINLSNRGAISYDVTSVDIGITSDMPNLPGFAENAIPAKPLGPFARRWNNYRETAQNPNVAVIGGGVAGAELAMAMAHALRARGTSPTVSLIDRGEILEEFAPPAKTRLLAALRENSVTLIEGATVAKVTKTAVHLADGQKIHSEFTTGAAGARPQEWLAQTGLETQSGFLAVTPELLCSEGDVFAVGDCAHLAFDPRPKAGVFAVRQAPILYHNLVAHLSGGRMRRYKPQKDYLKLISLGGKSALAEKLGTARSGPLLWRWKDRIDQKFMRQFRDLRPMQPTAPILAAKGVGEIVGQAPLCAGCGSKVGHDTLHGALKLLPQPERNDIVSLPGGDAAILKMGRTQQVISVDHLSAVVQDPDLMARIAAIHALGDIWAMGAEPQSALISLTLPRMSSALQARTLNEITLASSEIMRDAGAAIIGGHTTQGDSLTIGFTVTGISRTKPITLAGAKPGDALILTKPIGVGTLLAGEMRGFTRGDDMLACYNVMIQAQSDAAKILATAHAMTDVTGFGLAGHLSAICRNSDLGAILTFVPTLSGARALAADGVRSTLFENNRAAALPVNGAPGPESDLLFDPQTCGGLLAAVDQNDSRTLLEALKTAGYDAHIIGFLSEGAGISLQPN